MPNLVEKAFQKQIVASLIQNGFVESHHNDYNTRFGIDTKQLLNFLNNSSEKNKQSLQKWQNKYPQTWQNELLQKISLSLNRKSIDDFFKNGTNFGFEFFLNNQSKCSHLNIVSVTQELDYEAKKSNGNPRIDLVIFINGFPIHTIELKHTQSKATFKYNNKEYPSTFEGAIAQYRYDRNSENLLFKHRVISNFAMDEFQIYKNDKLDGDKSKFVPFNKDYKNPASDFFYKEFLTKSNILTLMDDYYYTTSKGIHISPRFHQFDGVEKVIKDIDKKGLGGEYLYQEAAGSGKTKQQCWLANCLYWTNKFNKIIMLSDRSVLDKNLMNDLDELSKSLDRSGSHTNFVNALKSDVSDKSLGEYISSPEPKVIVSTIQKFPYIKSKLAQNKSKTFAIIIDEAHSSTEGEYIRYVKGLKNDNKDNKNMCIFGFTATPRNQTLEIFKTKKPFYSYSHNQAVSEGMIVDVLNNEIKTYNRKITLKEPEVDELYKNINSVSRKFIDYVNNKPEVLRKECEMDLEHFLNKVEPELNHQAKIMFISSSRKNAQERAKMLKKILDERSLNYKVLCGFSGEVDNKDKDIDDKVTSIDKQIKTDRNDEITLSRNLTGDKSIDDVGDCFKNNPKYRILVCANKFQTGFDVPQLCALYVHRKMNSSSNAFQTYNRLNRKYDEGNKDKTFIVDWENDLCYITRVFKEFSDEKEFNLVTDKAKLLKECDVLIGLLNIQLNVVDTILKQYASETIQYNSYKKMRDNIPQLDTYCKYVDELQGIEKQKFKANLLNYKAKYQWLLNLEDNKEYSQPNDTKYKMFIFTKIVLNCLAINNYNDVNFDDVEVLKIDVQDRTSHKSIKISMPHSNEPKEIDLEITKKELVKQFNKQFGELGIKDNKAIEIVSEKLNICENDTKLIKQVKHNDFNTWKFEFKKKFEYEIKNTELYSMKDRDDFINQIVEKCGLQIFNKMGVDNA